MLDTDTHRAALVAVLSARKDLSELAEEPNPERAAIWRAHAAAGCLGLALLAADTGRCWPLLRACAWLAWTAARLTAPRAR